MTPGELLLRTIVESRSVLGLRLTDIQSSLERDDRQALAQALVDLRADLDLRLSALQAAVTEYDTVLAEHVLDVLDGMCVLSFEQQQDSIRIRHIEHKLGLVNPTARLGN